VQVAEGVLTNTIGAQNPTAKDRLKVRQEILTRLEAARLANGIRGSPAALFNVLIGENEDAESYIPKQSPLYQILSDFRSKLTTIQQNDSEQPAYIEALLRQINTYVYPQEDADGNKPAWYNFVPTFDKFNFNKSVLANALVALVDPNYTYDNLANAVGTYRFLANNAPGAAVALSRETTRSAPVLRAFMRDPGYFVKGLFASQNNRKYYLYNLVINQQNSFAKSAVSAYRKAYTEFASEISALPQIPTPAGVFGCSSTVTRDTGRNIQAFNNGQAELLSFTTFFSFYRLFAQDIIAKNKSLRDYLEKLIDKRRHSDTEKEILSLFTASNGFSDFSDMFFREATTLADFSSMSNNKKFDELAKEHPMASKYLASLKSIGAYFPKGEELAKGELPLDLVTSFGTFKDNIQAELKYSDAAKPMFDAYLADRYYRSYKMMQKNIADMGNVEINVATLDKMEFDENGKFLQDARYRFPELLFLSLILCSISR
jgi:hypothetical protein